MHSRIYQIEESKTELNKIGSIEASKYRGNHWFTNSIADYVSDIKPAYRQEELEYFYNLLKTHFGDKIIIDKENECFSFLSGFEKHYFEGRFKKLKETVNNLTLSEFCCSYIAYDLRELIKDEFSFYIENSNHGLVCFDDFVRHCIKDEKGTKYYIGGIVDYHY